MHVCVWHDSIVPLGIFVNPQEEENQNRIQNTAKDSLQNPASYTRQVKTNNSESQQWSINPQQKTIHNHLTFMPNFMHKKELDSFLLNLHLYYVHTDSRGASGSNKGEFHIK